MCMSKKVKDNKFKIIEDIKKENELKQSFFTRLHICRLNLDYSVNYEIVLNNLCELSPKISKDKINEYLNGNTNYKNDEELYNGLMGL